MSERSGRTPQPIGDPIDAMTATIAPGTAFLWIARPFPATIIVATIGSDHGHVSWEAFHATHAATPDAADHADELRQIAAAIEHRAAFAPLYRRYAPRVFGYCLRRIGDRDRAEDATSHIFLRALNGLRTFRPDPGTPAVTFRAWLFTIAHHVVADVYRRERHHASFDHPDREGQRIISQLPDPARTPDDLVVARDDARRLHAMLATLPERQRRVVELRLAGLTMPEIAQILGISLSAVKSAQFRAYRTLRDRFYDRYPGEYS